MGLSDFRHRTAHGYLFPLAVALSFDSAPVPDLPGFSTDLSLHAAPSHPEKSGDCLPIASSPMSGFIHIRRTGHFHYVTRPKRVRFRCGSQVRCSRLRQTDCSVPRSIGYMLN